MPRIDIVITVRKVLNYVFQDRVFYFKNMIMLIFQFDLHQPKQISCSSINSTSTVVLVNKSLHILFPAIQPFLRLKGTSEYLLLPRHVHTKRRQKYRRGRNKPCRQMIMWPIKRSPNWITHKQPHCLKKYVLLEYHFYAFVKYQAQLHKYHMTLKQVRAT